MRGFLGGTYRSQIHSLKRQRTVNLVPTIDESSRSEVESVGGFVRTPGLTSFATGLGAAVRGLHVAGSRLFAVAGTTLWEIDSSGTVTSRGPVQTDTKRAYLADNANGELFVQSGTIGYCFNLSTNALTVVTDNQFESGYGPAVYRDGYIVRVLEGQNRWQFTALNTAADWQGLNARSRTNDTLQGIAITGTVLWLFGTEYTEARYNSGSTSVWDPVPHGLMGVGLEAPESLASIGQVPYWLGRTVDGGLMVCRASGDSSFERVSTNALEAEWTTYGADARKAWAYAYTDAGAAFYVLSFPASGQQATFVYDARTGFWHEEGQSWTAGGGYEHVEGRCHAFFAGKHLVGSRQGGTVYEIDHDSDTLVGTDPVRWMRMVPAVQAQNRRVFHDRVALELDEPGAHPVTLRYSDDHGVTWSSPLQGAPLQGGDEFRQWKRLGRSRAGRLYEFSGETDVRLANAYLELRVGGLT